MRKTERKNGFLVCLLLNMLLNFEGIIPAAVLLVLHFAFKLPVWWAALAVALWIAQIAFWMLFTGWAGRCSREKNPQRENKNPYSVKAKQTNKPSR